jgi:hypothetical protein
MKAKPISLGLLLLFSIVATPSWASTVLSPDGATSTAGSYPGYDISNTTNWSGLSVTPDEVKNRDWDTYFGLNPCTQHQCGR